MKSKFNLIILLTTLITLVYGCSTDEVVENIPLKTTIQSVSINTNKVSNLDTSIVDFIIDDSLIKKIIYPEKHKSFELSPPCDIPDQYIKSRLNYKNTTFKCGAIYQYKGYDIISIQVDNNRYVHNYYFSYNNSYELIDVKKILFSCLDCKNWDHYTVITNGTSKDYFELKVQYYDTSSTQNRHPDQMNAINNEHIFTNKFGRFNISPN